MRFNDEESYKNDIDNDFSDGKYIRGFNNVLWNDSKNQQGFRNKINNAILLNPNIWNKEDKILGLFYISKNLLTTDNETSDDNDSRKKFINKVIRYLWFDVYKGEHESLIDILSEIFSIQLPKERILSFDILSSYLN